MARVLILLIAVAASVALLFGITTLNAETHTQALRRPQMQPNPNGGSLNTNANADAAGTVIAPEHLAPTPDVNATPRPTSPTTGGEAIRPTLVAPPNQPTYTTDDVSDYLQQSGHLDGVGSGPATTIADITFMTADEANALFNTSVSRSGAHPICVVTLHGQFPTSGPHSAATGYVDVKQMVFDGITGNLLMTSGSR